MYTPCPRERHADPQQKWLNFFLSQKMRDVLERAEKISDLKKCFV